MKKILFTVLLVGAFLVLISFNLLGASISNDVNAQTDSSIEVDAETMEIILSKFNVEAIERITGRPANYKQLAQGIVDLGELELGPDQTVWHILNEIHIDSGVKEPFWWELLEPENEMEAELKVKMIERQDLLEQIWKLEEQLKRTDITSSERSDILKHLEEVEYKWIELVHITDNLMREVGITEEHDHSLDDINDHSDHHSHDH